MVDKLVLSIVTGTYNRLRYLQRFIFSVRQSLPRGLSYEFIIVDGGSTDGTLEWLRQQPDVTLIEHGALLGAIRAFTDGGMAARGAYTLLANDDVEMVGNGLVKALVHLETHPDCGAVAFADDRPAPGYEAGYKVQTLRARHNGQPIDVPYAQVGLYRTWLMQHIGVWGADDTIMRESRTYGGDNFLSARIWELGYTVDAVEGVFINDLLAPDALREANVKDAESKPSPYYQRYPVGPELPDVPQLDSPQTERLRVLYLPIFEPGSLTQQMTKRGLREALAEHFLVYEFDYCNTPLLGEAQFADTLIGIVRTFQPHLMLCQLHGTERVTPAVLAKVRAARNSMVVVNWNGDTWRDSLVSERMLELLRHVDLQLVVNESVLSIYEANGISAAYWQVGYEPVPDALPVVHAHDVVLLANAYSDERHALGATLRALPYDVGLYGYGWPDGDGFTLYDFGVSAALYRAAKVAIGDNQYPGERGFVSNRLFEALANGAFLLHQRVEGLAELTGLEDGVHYVEWTDARDLKKKLKYWLADEHADERRAIAAAGETYTREHHSFSARVRDLFTELLPKVGEREPA